MFKTIKKYVKNKRTYNELMALSNRDLDDLGITRSEIYSIAFKKDV